MKAGKYRFTPFASSRGHCARCGEPNTFKQETGILLRLHAPFKRDLRICHLCLIEYVLRIDKRKTRDGRIVSEMLANLEGQTTETEKTDGRDRDRTGRDSAADMAAKPKPSRRKQK